jgi:hypothetical protein
MGVVVPLGDAQVAVDYRVNTRTDDMVVTFGVSPTDSGLDETDIANNVVAALASSGLSTLANFSNQYTLLGVRVYLRVSGGFALGIVALNNTGTGSFNTVPPQCAMLVQKRSPFGGRANRGRMYWPPCYLNEQTAVGAGGSFSGSDLTTQQTRFSSFRTDLITADIPMVIHHASGETGTPVSQLVVQGLLATQRSRIR